MNAEGILALAKGHVSTYLKDGDTLPIIVAVADPKRVHIGISIQRSFPLTLIERSYGIPFGRFRSDAVRLLSDPDELHGYKWSIQTHDAIFEADAATEYRLEKGQTRRVAAVLSTGLGNVLQNMRSIAYVDRTLYMVVGERPDHPPPYACLVEYSAQSNRSQKIGVELLLFSELGGCQQVDKSLFQTNAVRATTDAKAKFENDIRWAVSGYPLMLAGREVTLELTTRNVSDFRHVWRLPMLKNALGAVFAKLSKMDRPDRIEFYFGFDEIREKRNFVLATREEPLRLPLELSMTEEWIETMCNVCKIDEHAFRNMEMFNKARYAISYDPAKIRKDFIATDYSEVMRVEDVENKGQFFIDIERNEIVVKLLPAVYPHHIVGVDAEGNVVNISICGKSGRSGITIGEAKKLCKEAGLQDALIFDNGQDVFARLQSGDIITNEDAKKRQTRLTAALHFASLLDPGPAGGCEIVSDDYVVKKSSDRPEDILGVITPGVSDIVSESSVADTPTRTAN